MFDQVGGREYHDFPSIESLADDGVEANLRDMGFGYRAAYIAKTAQQIKQHHSSHYLHDLRHKSYDRARAKLLKLHGVGAKVGMTPTDLIDLYQNHLAELRL